MSTERKDIEYRYKNVETSPAAQHSWTDDQGKSHTVLSWDSGKGNDSLNPMGYG